MTVGRVGKAQAALASPQKPRIGLARFDGGQAFCAAMAFDLQKFRVC
jgi:hypothetical protein